MTRHHRTLSLDTIRRAVGSSQGLDQLRAELADGAYMHGMWGDAFRPAALCVYLNDVDVVQAFLDAGILHNACSMKLMLWATMIMLTDVELHPDATYRANVYEINRRVNEAVGATLK